MKHNHNHDNAACAGPKPTTVRFAFSDAAATHVCVAGTFNNWEPENKAMHSSGDGNWWKETALEPGTYEYCFVVDGRWIPDPLARETVPNPFGGRNSILKVATSPEAAHLADAEELPLEADRFGDSTVGDHLVALENCAPRNGRQADSPKNANRGT